MTGGSRGIGLAVVECLLAHGASVVCVSRTAPPLTHPHLLSLTEDLSAGDLRSVCSRIVDATLSRFGRITAVVNNAGALGNVARFEDVSAAEYHKNWVVNFAAPVELVRAALDELRVSRGRVINVSSGAAVKGYPGWSAYCASKAALKMWTESLAAEERAIVAINFRPGVVDTEMQKQIRETGARGMGSDTHARFVGLHENKQLLPPSTPGNKIAYLCLHGTSEQSGEFIDVSDENIPLTFK